MKQSYILCDNIRVVELASELHNSETDMDLALFICGALASHLDDGNDSIFELGDFATIELSPSEGVVELTIRYDRAHTCNYQFYGIKQWTLEKLVHISDELSQIIDRDIHTVPNYDDPVEYYADFGEE